MDQGSEQPELPQALSAAELELRERGFLSHTHERFVEYIEQQPEELLRTSYASLHALDQSTLCLAQPWPVLLSTTRIKMFEAVAVHLVKILLDLPRRIFNNDPARYVDFYHIGEDQAQLISSLVDSTNILSLAATRGDYLETTDGLKVLEFNVGGGLGGWSVGAWTRCYLADPLVRGFFEQSGLDPAFTTPPQAIFRRILEEAGTLSDDGEFNIAFVVRAAEALVDTGTWAEDYALEYQMALEAFPAFKGETITCCITDLHEDGRVLRYGERRVHAVVEACEGVLTRPVISTIMAGTVRVYNGPVSRVLTDKLNLALLSEMADSGLLEGWEQDIVQAHVPWTRRVSAEFVDFKGERAYLPDLLCEQQERMVIKLGFSAHGDDVFIGPGTSPEAWAEIIERALSEDGWIAQEFLEGRTYLFQVDDDPQRPPVPHDLVWGLFTTGTQYGGCFVRLMARGGHGVINAARGACVGAVFEVENDEAGDGTP